MGQELKIRPEAEAEMFDAAAWYEARRHALGREFLEEVEKGLIEIQLHPKRFPIVHPDVRRILIHRFPYGIYYTTTENAITIIAVFHGSRSPKRWQDRLKS
jgi:toxin ParE1/3/4